MHTLPPNLDAVIEGGWQKTRLVPGYLGEREARFLGLLAACVPAEGPIVEIGSFKGRSTVMLASVAAHYGFGPVVAIDPHIAPSAADPTAEAGSSTLKDFLASLRSAGVESNVEIHRAYSRDVAKLWNRPIRLLWIDGSHRYEDVLADLEGFAPHVIPGGHVALHDTRGHGFPGVRRAMIEYFAPRIEFNRIVNLHNMTVYRQGY